MNTVRLLVSSLALGTGLLAGVAAAEEAPAAPATADAPAGDIVVSAQRRNESAQKVPLAITAISGDTLQQQTIDSAVDVAKFAPNVNAWNNDGRTRPRYYIRGIGNGNVANNAVGAISVSQDEVYLNSLALQGFPLLDLERVEVLSGPQGTLQGKNSTAGAINFISRKPEFVDTNGYANLSWGDYGQRQLETAAGGRIDDRFAWRAAARIERQGGLALNRYDDTQVGDFTDIAARLQLRARLADGAVDVLASGHYRHLDATHTPFYAAIQGQSAPLGIGNRNYDDSNLDDTQKLDSSGGFIRVDAHLPASLKLTSITSYDEGDRTEFLDGDYSTRELSRSYGRTKPEQLTQEIRLISPDGWFSWILGGYYFHERLNSFAATATLSNASGGTPGYYYTQFTQYTNSAAVFGTTRFDLTKKLHLQGGLRWTSDDTSIHLVSQKATSPVSFSGTSAWYLPGSTGQTLTDIARQNQSAHWNKLTWDVALRWEATRNISLYGRIANGYRAGNFQGQVAATTPPGLVNPETLTSYEAGVKTQWLGGKLVFNADVFHADYNAIQVSVVQSTVTGINAQLANAGAGFSEGFEAELRAQPVSRLTLSGNLGLLRTRFTQFTISNATANINGNEFARAPHVTVFVNADYRIPLGHDSLTLGTDWHYTSRYYYIITDEKSPALQQAPVAVGNVRVSYATHEDRVTFTLAVNNVAGATYTTQVLPYSYSSYGYTLGNPRTVLGSVRLRY